MEETLIDVSNAIQSRCRRSFSRLKCFVVNYSATSDFPHKFFYNGCTGSKANGMYCGRSMDSMNRCLHNGSGTPMYRFQLQLTDRSPSSPVTVTIFEQAHILMGISAEQLSRCSMSEQLELIRKATSTSECVEVYLKVKEDAYRGEFVAVVQLLFCLERIQNEVLDQLVGTPPRSIGDLHTPRGEECGIGSSSGRRTSSGRRGKGGRTSSSQLSSVKTKLQDLIEIIDLTNLED